MEVALFLKISYDNNNCEQLFMKSRQKCRQVHNAFLRALLSHDLESMNEYMNNISNELFSSFATGKKPSAKLQPERFYHGFVLRLMVELRDRYSISSNKENGFGRYDIMIKPKDKGTDAFIIEFKVVHAKRGETLETAVQATLQQIEEKWYDTILINQGIQPEKIWKYGFAFLGQGNTDLRRSENSSVKSRR